MNLNDTLCFASKSTSDELGDDMVLYFCADDLYGYYSFNEMSSLLINLAIRLVELREEYEKNH